MSGAESVVDAVDAAVTWLFVPGDRPDRFASALASSADIALIDLEDAVVPEAKPDARRATREALAAGERVAVRISSPRTADGHADLEMLVGSVHPPLAVMVARAETPEDLAGAAALGVPIVPLVETARGLLGAEVLAGAPGVARLAFGAVDYALDVGATADDDVLASVRTRLVAVSRARDIGGPIDSPSLELRDEVAVAAAARLARRFGMTGKLCIHPAQIGAVASAFRPDPEELAAAREILSAARHDGASSVAGRMIDRPVIERARRIVARAERA